jgi:hypothetical protein
LHTKSASIEQIGDINQAMLRQTDNFGMAHQLATIIQHGTGNQATALQQ